MAQASVGSGAGLLEREDEVALLGELASGAALGQGAVAAVVGSAGIGKSSLLEVAIARAGDEGLVVLTARGGELERELPFGIVRQVFERHVMAASPSRRRAWLSGAAALAKPALGHGVSSGAGTDPFSVLHGLFWLCANLAEREPVMLAIDDAHWADAESLRWLAYLARRLEDLAVLVVLAARLDEPAAGGQPLEAILADPTVVQVHPAALSEAAVARMVRAELAAEASESFCRACASATGGNPFFLGQLIVAARADALSDASLDPARVALLAAAHVAPSVMIRLGRLGEDAVEVARAIAVLAAGATVARLSALSGVTDSRVCECIESLADAGFVGCEEPLDFVHPLMREAIYQDMPAATRSHWHSRAAVVIAEQGGGSDSVAAHLLLAEPAADPWVVKQLRRAAADARIAGAPETSRRYLRRALDEPPTEAAAAEVLHELGIAIWHDLDLRAGAEHLQGALRCATDTRLRAVIALKLGRALAYLDRMAECRDLLDTMVVELDPMVVELDPRDSALRAELEAERFLWTAAWWTNDDRRDDTLARLETAAAQADPTSLPGRKLLAALAANMVARGEPIANTLAVADRAAAHRPTVPDPEEEVHVEVELIVAYLYCERLETALRVVNRLTEQLEFRGFMVHATGFNCWRAMIELRQGNLRAAESDAHAALEAIQNVPRDSPPWWLLMGPVIETMLTRGDLESAQQLVDEYQYAPPKLEGYAPPNPGLVLSELRLSQGRLAESVELSQAAGRWASARGYENPNRDGWRPLLAPALAALGRVEEARAIGGEAVDRAQRFGGKIALGVALRSLAVVEGGDLELLEQSVLSLEGSEARLEHARSLVEYGAALRRANRRSAAREPLCEGLRLAERCGAKSLIARAGDELAATGARPRRELFAGVDSLTPSELRVARLAADGLGNREIAQRLFVTRKTVEKHLGNTYMKLNIQAREQLPEALRIPRS